MASWLRMYHYLGYPLIRPRHPLEPIKMLPTAHGIVPGHDPLSMTLLTHLTQYLPATPPKCPPKSQPDVYLGAPTWHSSTVFPTPSLHRLDLLLLSSFLLLRDACVACFLLEMRMFWIGCFISLCRFIMLLNSRTVGYMDQYRMVIRVEWMYAWVMCRFYWFYLQVKHAQQSLYEPDDRAIATGQ